MIRFTCGQCGFKHELDDHFSGETVNCRCREVLCVPGSRKKRPPVEQQKPNSPPVPPAPVFSSEAPAGLEPWYFGYVELSATIWMTVGSIVCFVAGMLVLNSLGKEVSGLAILLGLLATAVCITGVIFSVAMSLLVLDGVRSLRRMDERHRILLEATARHEQMERERKLHELLDKK